MGSSGEGGLKRKDLKPGDVFYYADERNPHRFVVPGANIAVAGALVSTGAETDADRLVVLISRLSEHQEPKPDDVTKPAHYTRLVPEPIEVLESWGVDWHTGNIIKYLVRAGHKPGADVVTDLKKAEQYLKRLIALKEKQK